MIPGMGRGMSPAKMKQMMKQMGISIESIDDVEQVIIRTPEKDIVFRDAQVTIMDARGAKTYQVVGTPEEVPREPDIPEEDVRLVSEQTGASREEAVEALKQSKGDIAEAIMKLSE
jgi:nascent polypeptide-associated complex subunit alpha